MMLVVRSANRDADQRLVQEGECAVGDRADHDDEEIVAAERGHGLGAGIAAGDGALLERAFNDVLHEPYRMADAPVLADLRAKPVPGSAGATLSGSGPTVVCWAWPGQAEAVAAELERRAPGARVLPLRIATNGTEAV